MQSFDITKLIREAVDAIENEIKAVQEQPSTDVLTGGKRDPDAPQDQFTYIFPHQNPSFQYIDTFTVINTDEELKGTVDFYDEETIKITLESPIQEPVTELQIEWINDYILQCTLDRLKYLLNPEAEDKRARIGEVLEPDEGQALNQPEKILEDGLRNEAQIDAIKKSQVNRVTYVWGPPGTGKTATLGFIMANYLANNKRVLFVSNTNRAVDVGLMSVISALQDLGIQSDPNEMTRFGDAALDSDAIQNLIFDNQLETLRKQLLQQVSTENSDVQTRRRLLLDTINKLIAAGQKVPPKMEEELEAIGSDDEADGDENEAKEALLDELEMLPFKEIRRKKLIATTLARICTGDLLTTLTFDAVVVDEASMANIPYLLVLIAKSKEHVVFAGDPMQLPPIAVTGSFKHRNFLEKDIYTLVSKADSMEGLFHWRDEHQSITSFFDTQYRLQDDLADIISDVFYKGRLRSAGVSLNRSTEDNSVSVHLVDTRRYNPSLIVNRKEGSGFRPENPVHRDLVMELVRRLMLNERVPAHQIGIIVPFRNAVWDYRRDLREKRFWGVEVGTIHTFQGREKSAIIFDSVMSGQGSGKHKRHFSVRPFDETKNGLSVPRLLNVAFSRAKEKLVVLADMQHIEEVYKGRFLNSLLTRFQRIDHTG